MFEQPHLWRAEYDQSRETYVVTEAGWQDNTPNIEYRFYFWDDEDDNQGGLEKTWLDDKGHPFGEFYPFGSYENIDAFNDDIRHIQDEARELSEQENLDYFLAIIDIVKMRAIEAELDGEGIFISEGLFETGPEDAYTLRSSIDYDTRLHHHVERSQDECWRIHVLPVMTPQQHPLGWGVFALLYPGYSLKATPKQLEDAPEALVLDLSHHNTKFDAHFGARTMLAFMFEGGRVRDPEFAYMDDSTVLECSSVQCSAEKIVLPEWQPVDKDELKKLQANELKIVRDPERWHASATDMITEFANEIGLQTHLADQLDAHLRDDLQVHDLFGEDSPWRFLDETDA